MAGPSDTVDHLTQAINRGDLETALALYETNAVLVVQPGRLACGTTQLREAPAAITSCASDRSVGSRAINLASASSPRSGRRRRR